MNPIKDLLKHSSIYMIGQILIRMASVILLPFYTHFLSPADYGVIAILDLTAAVLGTVICEGMISAAMRHHFDKEDEGHVDTVWWTGLVVVMATGAVLLLPMWSGRNLVADIGLGSEITAGPWFVTLALATIMAGLPAAMFESHLRVCKRSTAYVLTSLARLFINVALNVWLLSYMRMGVEGLMLGNLIATMAHSVILAPFFLRTRGRFSYSPALASVMLKYNAPLVVSALLAMLMHEADRCFLRIWQSMEQVGIYSLAHKIGFAINTLCLLSFNSIWNVAIYDIERLPNARQVFGKVFGWFTSGMGILLLGAALTIHPVLPWLVPESYDGAADLVAVVLLGFFVFGLNFMFEVPALLTKQTRLLVPGSIAGLTVNVLANIALVPLIGAWGAAWAGVLTYAVFSITIWWCCRHLLSIRYPWLSSMMTTLAFCGTYIACRYLLFPLIDPVAEIAVSVVVCAIWAVVCFGRDGLNWWRSGRKSVVKDSVNSKPPAALVHS